ncbi:MAG TPA: glutamine synthetase family protein [Steroidobacteraceae bacterium]|nr:glutamine synthetase family protein [Steroidobacteraceae bacterium]
MTHEIDRFSGEHPDLEWVDAFMLDVNGLARGKRMPASDLRQIYSAGVQFSACAPLLDVRGLGQGAAGLGTEDGDPDGTGWPLPHTLKRVPWALRPTAQVVLELRDVVRNERLWWDQRVILEDVVTRCRADGIHPVVACELEFYLIDPRRERNAPLAAAASPLTGRPPRAAANLSLAALDEYAVFLAALQEAAVAQDIPASSAVAEYGLGQFEINLHHISDPLKAADHAALLRRLVKGVAQAHGMDATFMPKPFLQQPGNGFHIHVSIVDADGNNRFGGPEGDALLRHAVAGMQALTLDSLAIFAPHFNAHRRYQSVFVPRTLDWGYNNRSVAFRIPVADAAAMRIEHRVAGADASPHLVMAAVLAALHHGITHRLTATPPLSGRVFGALPEFSAGLLQSLLCLEESETLADYIPLRYLRAYAELKRAEYEELMEPVLPGELDFYL